MAGQRRCSQSTSDMQLEEWYIGMERVRTFGRHRERRRQTKPKMKAVPLVLLLTFVCILQWSCTTEPSEVSIDALFWFVDSSVHDHSADVAGVITVSGGRCKVLDDRSAYLSSPDGTRSIHTRLHEGRKGVTFSVASCYPNREGENADEGEDLDTVMQKLDAGRELVSADAEVRLSPLGGIRVKMTDVMDVETGARAQEATLDVCDEALRIAGTPPRIGCSIAND